MSGELQVANVGPRYQAYQMVVHHDQREDFSVYRPAGLVLRAYALTLDLFLSAPLDVLVHLPFHRYMERLTAYGHDGKHLLFTILLAAIPILGYFVAPTLLYGQTLGKKIVGLRVLTRGCSTQLSPLAVLARETVGKVLSLALLGSGFVMAGFEPRKRALHDLLTGTVVVSYRER